MDKGKTGRVVCVLSSFSVTPLSEDILGSVQCRVLLDETEANVVLEVLAVLRAVESRDRDSGQTLLFNEPLDKSVVMRFTLSAWIIQVNLEGGDVCYHEVASLGQNGLQANTLQTGGQLLPLVIQHLRQLQEVTLWRPKELVLSPETLGHRLLSGSGTVVHRVLMDGLQVLYNGPCSNSPANLKQASLQYTQY